MIVKKVSCNKLQGYMGKFEGIDGNHNVENFVNAIRVVSMIILGVCLKNEVYSMVIHPPSSLLRGLKTLENLEGYRRC